jgi:Lon-like protease
VVVVIILVAAAFIRVPYVIIRPGTATPLDESVVQVSGTKTYPHRGDLLFLTVSVSNRDPNLYRWLFAKLDPDAEVDRRETIIGCAGYAASQRLAVDQMAQSQDAAKTVALRRLGYAVPDQPSRVQVVDVECGGPADGHLQLGDIITAVDGKAVTGADEVRPLVQAHAAGDRIVFTVERDGKPLDVGVRVGERTTEVAPGERQTVPYVGIVTQTVRRHEFPVDVRIDTARVSGPSAGLAFALGIIDDLTPGNLTGGGNVAVTGTILEDGSVGIVGGVKQKAVTARRAGARLMLVPDDEVKAARERADGMKVVGVATVDDALRALERAGGDAIAVRAATAQ